MSLGDGRVPLLVIDGQEVAWDELGRMLMSFEGWQFRLAIWIGARRCRTVSSARMVKNRGGESRGPLFQEGKELG